MNLELFIACRIYGDQSGGLRFSRPAVRVAMAGIAIGLAVMIVSIAVVTGFKREVSGKVIGFGSHAQVLSLSQDQNFVVMPVVTNDTLKRKVASVGGVRHVQEFASVPAMLKTDDDFRCVQVKGVGETYDMNFLRRYLVKGEIPDYTARSASNQILLSQRIADELRLKCGDKVFSYFLGNGQTMRARRFQVAGIYETHLSEYDRVMCFTDIYTVRRLNGWKSDESSGLEVEADNFNDIDACVGRINALVNHRPDRSGAFCAAFSIREIAPHIFSWLDVLDTNVVMILVLMLAIGGFTVVSGLLIVMLERVQMMGVLKALGATDMQVRRIFIHFSVFLVGQGMAIGNAVGIVLCYAQRLLGLVRLDASTYYIDTVPIEMHWGLVLAVNAGVLLVATLVIFASSFLISIKGVASAMRYE